jgi:transcriptional regulator with XRE-family HTH domain
MEPIVPKLKRLLRERNISHAYIADRLEKHRTFITRKLGSDSMETRLLESILEATGISYHDLFCQQSTADDDLRRDLEALRREVDLIKEQLPTYRTRQNNDGQALS